MTSGTKLVYKWIIFSSLQNIFLKKIDPADNLCNNEEISKVGGAFSAKKLFSLFIVHLWDIRDVEIDSDLIHIYYFYILIT